MNNYSVPCKLCNRAHNVVQPCPKLVAILAGRKVVPFARAAGGAK